MDLERIKTIVTGKNKLEREQERAALQKIRKVQNAAYYQQKEKESIRLAQQKAKFESDTQLARMKVRAKQPSFIDSFSNRQPKQYSSPFGGVSLSSGLSGGFGMPTKRYDPISGRYISIGVGTQKRKKRKSKGKSIRIVYE